MTYLNHITLSTGHTRRSPRAEVSDGTIKALTPCAVVFRLAALWSNPTGGQYGLIEFPTNGK